MKSKITIEEVLSALDKVEEPELHDSLVKLHMVQNINIEGDLVSFDLILTTPACPLKKQIEASARQAVMDMGVRDVIINMKSIVPRDVRIKDNENIGISNILAIASGKGGVGKSTIAVNLAIVLGQMGARVGLMDADIYGPNLHTMLGVNQLPTPKDGKIIPAEAHGIKMISIGLMVDPKQPLVWRGPMLHSAIKQFLLEVQWGELDYLIVDLPPGTGDAQISLSQIIKLTAGIIVTLPQKVSVDDARRAAYMFEQVSVPIIGVIENMSYLLMPDGSKNAIFGEGGGMNLANELNVPYLGELPIDPAIRIGGDNGKPITVAIAESASSKVMNEITCRIAAQISMLDKKLL
jgi:ATP-binding protein involved in chromosome partitioning